ncbi:Uncharacterized conserved protein YfdQ, DUF2303 family [Halopseudomonas litoralis]|uniref:Uncharacterized conserved protein YfdQ, DUF2303 family n=1 Tax=Halopseudomonas litoralis TaxID=797277 RepID=A0A1H1NTE8_9GAMM|nr:DUF2303 family protein [Halopseudomonas litoralis]SDS02256.1 Uncharacterized conserved protein YfdQ, DUF2303 family [Halopseudomonas litoralis]
MLTIDTLNQITATHAAATGRELGTHTPAILLPEHYAVQNMERLHEYRARFRSCMKTNSLPDFCNYVERRTCGDQTAATEAGFIDADSMSCEVIFNLGDEAAPGHADDTATIKLKPTAAYAAMRAIAGSRVTQTQLAEWMEDWATNLKVTGTNGEDIPVGVAVQKIRTITIKATAERTSTEGSFSAGRSAMDQIEAAHAEQQPNDLLFTIKPYEGLEERTFTLRLSVITGDKPVLVARWVQQEAQEEEIAQEFKAVLTAEIGGFVHLTLGSFDPGK